MKHLHIILSAVICAVSVSSCKKDDNLALKADFTYSTDHVKVGEEVVFTSTSTGMPSRYDWIFEGAEKEESALSQPSVRWMDAGTYTVSLRVSNREMSDEIVKEKIITVDYHASVKADFSFDKKMAFNNEEVTFVNESEGFPNNVKWTFTSDNGEVLTSGEKGTFKMKFNPGVYSIKLEISSPVASDVKEVLNAFTILDENAVMAEFSVSNRTAYEGGTVTFKSQATGKVQDILWEFEGGIPATSAEENPTVTYTAAGRYKVKMTVSNNIGNGYSDVCEKTSFINVVKTYGGSMVFMLPFDGDAKDYGPHGIHPSIYSLGGLAPAYETGHGDGYGQAMRFPGGTKGKSYSVLLMPDAGIEANYPQGSDMTLSLWYKVEDVEANQAIFAQGHSPGFESSNQIWGRFQTGHKFRVTAEKTGVSGTNGSLTVTNEKFDDGNWHHLAVVYERIDDGGTKKRKITFYLDGIMVGTPPVSADKDTYTTPYCIGANTRLTNNAIAPENMYTGLMDDYILYRKALTETEVKELAAM